MRQFNTILVTGGAGFIGSHVVRHLVKTYPKSMVINFDKLTYSGNLENIKDIEHHSNYRFVRGDIVKTEDVESVFRIHAPDAVVHLAAESHVDRSITDPLGFVHTNVLGTVQLLEAARKYWKGSYSKRRFYHVSTDEVYGALGAEGKFSEATAYDPHSPYAASKAASDHFVRAYGDTYGMDVVLSNCSNNYGPNHFPEKLIPLAIHRIKNHLEIPIYGKGENIRDWLWVEDHAKAIDLILHQARPGITYNIGSNNEWKNIDLIRFLCQIMDRKLGRPQGESEALIRFVKDREGHDLRYAIDASKLKVELGWAPEMPFETGLEKTVDWYLENETWLNRVISGDYKKYYEQQYASR